MKIVVVPASNFKLYRSLYNISAEISVRGSDVTFISGWSPPDPEPSVAGMTAGKWIKTKLPGPLIARIPALRGAPLSIVAHLCSIRPSLIIAEQQYMLPALVYKIAGDRRVRLVGYYADYWPNRWYAEITKYFSNLLYAYVDVCDVRVQWRKQKWPRMRAKSFTVRQAPQRRVGAEHQDHHGATKVVFTSSRYVLGLNRERLSSFIDRLCSYGISLDWYLPGPAEVRLDAQSLSSHDLFRVLEPAKKSQLPEVLGRYDAGLHWAPMAERAYDPYYFDSAASNKIGEYIAAGLVVGHAGNPGLSYLPADVCAIFDPTDPEAGADQLASALADRGEVERKREAALRYHLGEMNLEAQAEPFVQYILQQA